MSTGQRQSVSGRLLACVGLAAGDPMYLKSRILASASSVSVAILGALLAGSAAEAQSTGSQTVEAVVVTAAKTAGTDGLAVIVRSTKEQSIVTKDFIEHQVGSANFAQLIDLVPGVTYSTNDPTGLSSSDIHIHGFDGAHLSFTVDGTPLNDTGNYAIYPGEYAVGESIDRIVVNTGQTEVDSPTASSIGGTVNIITKLPTETPEATVSATTGSASYRRFYGEINSGAFGPTGLRARLSVNSTHSDKYKGPGALKRQGIDGDLYQPLNGDDFMKAAFTYTQERNNFYGGATLATIANYGRQADYNAIWVPPTISPTTGYSYPAITNQANNSDANYYGLRINPVNFGDLRGQSKFTLGRGLTLTVDPYFFYTLANGGGNALVNQTTDVRLIGSGGAGNCSGGKIGISLGRDGNCGGSVYVYQPSNTETHRYGVNNSLIYKYDDHNSLQLSYSLDYGRHRQTGQASYIDQATGNPANVFGGKNGYGPAIPTLDGSTLRSRDRFSIAQLNQFSVNYVGKFFDDRLHINLGVRDPKFQRQLNQYCYNYNGSNQLCDTVSPTLVAAALAADGKAGVPGAKATNLSTLLGTTITYGANGAPNFRAPFKQTYNFEKVLPNAGASYDIDNHNSVYATVSKGFSAPRTDNLYTSQPETVKPETTSNYAVGYRFNIPRFSASVSYWNSQWKNHIVTSVDPNDPTLSIDRNVGGVSLHGVDLELGWRVTDAFKLYVSASDQVSHLKANLITSASSGPDKLTNTPIYLPTKGKELVYTPDQQYTVRGEYVYEGFTVGLTGKFVGERYESDVNDSVLKSNLLFNADVRYTFPTGQSGHKTSIQLNVYNLFDRKYYNSAPSASNFQPITYPNGDVVNAASPGSYTIGYPTAVYLNLKTSF